MHHVSAPHLFLFFSCALALFSVLETGKVHASPLPYPSPTPMPMPRPRPERMDTSQAYPGAMASVVNGTTTVYCVPGDATSTAANGTTASQVCHTQTQSQTSSASSPLTNPGRIAAIVVLLSVAVCTL